MNTAAVSRKRRRKRSYDNRLRARQAEQTRVRILDTVIELITERGDAAFSLAELASRAGVSEPTLYRHFGSREGLYDAVDAHVQERLELPAPPESIERLGASARVLYERFAEHEELLQAASVGGLGSEMRHRGKARRYERVQQLVHDGAGHLEERDARTLAALVRSLLSMDAFVKLRSELGLDADQAADAVEWALEAFVEKLERDREGGRSSLRRGPVRDEPQEGGDR